MNYDSAMAANSGVQQPQQHFQQQQHQQNSPHHCKECGIYLNSAESLEVHLQYHKENLLKNWAIQAATSHSEETNNNTTKTKREFVNNTIAAADSSDSMQKKSPEYSRATPDTIFGHPPTPQSYQSASSPYQNHDNSAFSPNFQYNQQIKSERNSPNPNYNYQNYPEQFFPMDQQYQQDYMPKNPIQNSNSYRYHPYNQTQQQQSSSSYDRAQSQVSSSSPAFPPQPTPSPSPKQCDKCGYVCESATQLIDHLNMAHPPTPAPLSYQSNFMFPEQVKTEEDAQSEILDLDSHKVHQVYQEEEKRNGEHPHSVNAMLNSWSPTQQQPKMFHEQQQRMFMQNNEPHKIFPQNVPDKMYPEQKLFQPHQMGEFPNGGVTTTTEQSYRPFEHLPSAPATPAITSTQVPNNPAQASPVSKSTSWKSNEARRPKTYNCTACNKWFTSSGHLKRHYNTTLHKNAVKSSGQPDPASLPISAHHHPARDPPREDVSASPEESRDDTNSMPAQFERPNPMVGLLQQPPNGPYDRNPGPPNIHHTPPLHSPMGQPGNPIHIPNESPPNGEAGPSTNNIDSRGLLSLSTPNMANTPHGFNMSAPMMPMESSQFQMYPNESAPHVTQAMVINNLSTTGEYQFGTMTNSLMIENQPLPSFAQIQAHRYGLLLSYGNANVGGGGPATAPYSSYPDLYEVPEKNMMYREEDEYKLTVLTPADPAPQEEDFSEYRYSPNNQSEDLLALQADAETKMQVMEDIKMRLEAQPASPEKAHTKRDIKKKRDYEENTGSPVITSTVITKSGLHKCYDCDKLFNKACYLTQHNKTFHSGDKPFKCHRCGKRFSCEKIYQEHLTKHAGDKPHKCDLCPKQFNHKTDLKRHMCLHTGRKPYACDTCGKGFIRKDHMTKHCETHWRKTQSKVAALR